MTRRRYGVFALMFLAIFVNYMDRVNFSVSIPAIRHTFHFSLEQIGAIGFAWGIVYAVFNFPGGWMVDRLGLRWGLVTTLGWWSVFTILTPFARTLGGWFLIRGVMGAGEAPIWPLNAKCGAAWAAPRERSTLYTLAGSGQYLGPVIGTMLAGLILKTWGWQWTFIIFGVAGMALLPFWAWYVRDRPESDPRVNAQERAHIGVPPSAREAADWTGIRNVFFSRTGVGMFLVYLTFGYVLFTFLSWTPSYMFYTFHMSIFKGALWASVSYAFGFAGFVLSGPFNDSLVKRLDRLTARRIGSAAPMLCGVLCMIGSIFSARAGLGEITAVSIGVAQLFMNMTVGAWAVNVIDISPNRASTGFVYGVYNGVLNLMGACSSLILAWIATRFGFPVAFGSAIIFMLVFVASMLFVVDRRSYAKLIARATPEATSGT